MKSVKLSSGISIPEIGFGLWKNKDHDECVASIRAALEAGYRHFDTAQAYGNEEFLGEVIASTSIPRSELFITTKIKVENMVLGNVEGSFDHSLEHLQTDYVDLLLLHFPVTLRRQPAWPKMEKIYKSGRAKTIGVSNYTIRHLEELLGECNIKPAVNQVELHVFLRQPELVKYCQDHGIVVEAYSPLAHGERMADPELAKIAKKHGKTPAQIMIRWCLEIGTVPLPKSVTPERIRQNLDVLDFKLDDADLTAIAGLESDLRTCWDPTHVL